MELTEDFNRMVDELAKFMNNDIFSIIQVEGLSHFKDSFDNEGFTDNNLVKWDKRATTDNKGRNKTRYRTNRKGRAGELNQYGRRNRGRPVLTGHATSGDKLRNSLSARRGNGFISFHTYKKYAKRHNEGLKGMPKRQFMGASKRLDARIEKKINQRLKRILS